MAEMSQIVEQIDSDDKDLRDEIGFIAGTAGRVKEEQLRPLILWELSCQIEPGTMQYDTDGLKSPGTRRACQQQQRSSRSFLGITTDAVDSG